MTTHRRLMPMAAALALVASVVAIPTSPAGAVGGTVAFDSASTSVGENAGAVVISVSRSDATDAMSVDYVVSGANVGDFTVDAGTTSGTLVMGNGVSTGSLTVTIVDDQDGEGGTETFGFTLLNPQNLDNPGDAFVVGAQGAHRLDITDDGDAGTIVFATSNSSHDETDAASSAVVSVTRTGGTEGAVSGTIRRTSGSASPGSDFVPVNQVLNWADGEGASKDVTVGVVGDNDIETPDTETVVLSVTGTSGGAAAGAGTHTLTINDDDNAGVIELADAVKNVGEAAGTVTVNFQRVGGDDGLVSTAYSTSDLTAEAGLDYTSDAGTVIMGQGITTASIDIPIADDFDSEGNETFQVQIAGDNTVVTIIDNDNPLFAFADSYTTPEDTALVATQGVLDNDTGPGGVDLDVVSFGATSVGSLSDIDLETGTFTFTPPPNFEGQAFFTYTMTDGVDTRAGTVTITVTDDNTAPVAVDDEFALLSRLEPTVLDVVANDTDQDGDTLGVASAVFATSLGNTVDCSSAETCTFTPTLGFVGIDSFDYTAVDPAGATSIGSVTVLVGIPRGCDAVATPGVPLNGTEGSDVLCGSTGNDIINGAGGDDFILGGGGNDTLSGGNGKDLLAGQDGNDLLVPGRGESDDSVGGDGVDTVSYVGSAPGTAPEATGADTVFVSETAISIDTTNDQATPIEDVDDGDTHESVENIVVDLLGGSDVVTVQPGDNASIDLRGGPSTDRLKYDTSGVTGVTDDGSAIRATGKQPVFYSSFEIRETDIFIRVGNPTSDFWVINSQPLLEGLILDQAGSGDTMQVRFGSLLGPLEVADSGTSGVDRLEALGSDEPEDFEVRPSSLRTPDETLRFSGVEELTIKGNGGNDRFTINVVAGFRPNDLSPGLLIDGGPGSDTLIINSDTSCEIVGDIVELPGIGTFAIAGIEVFEYDCGGDIGIMSFESGYWIVDDNGDVTNFGLTHFGDVANPTAPVVGIAGLDDNQGYWVAESNGAVSAFGSAVHRDDLPGLGIAPAHPIVGIAGLASGDGYYLLGTDGGVFAFNAPFYGSTGDIVLDLPVSAMATAPGGGYWFVAADGGIFAYGPGAAFHGSVPQYVRYADLQADIVGMAATASGNGYWLVAADGGIFAFGDAVFHGSVPGVLGGATLDAPIVGMVATPTGNGYWVIAEDGGVFTFGDAVFLGSLGGSGAQSVVALAG